MIEMMLNYEVLCLLKKSKKQHLFIIFQSLTKKILNKLTLGMLFFETTLFANNLSLISQANIVEFSILYWRIFSTISGVATRGLLPPIDSKYFD